MTEIVDDFDSAVVVALGSNLAAGTLTPAELVNAAMTAMTAAGLVVVRRSSLWRSSAWPDPTDPPYLNAVALVETQMDPPAALAQLHEIEASFGRERRRLNTPRTLDLDLIAYGRRLSVADPVLPHRRASERLFVMGPLAEIAPDWRHPVDGRTAWELAQMAKVGCDAQMLTS